MFSIMRVLICSGRRAAVPMNFMMGMYANEIAIIRYFHGTVNMNFEVMYWTMSFRLKLNKHGGTDIRICIYAVYIMSKKEITICSAFCDSQLYDLY